MKPRPFAFIVPVLWAVLIYVLLTMPESDLPKASIFDVIYFDKWVHAGLFAGLVFLFSWPFRKLYPTPHRLLAAILVLGLLYGIAMEYVQKYFTPDRHFDLDDMLADGFGCLLGYVAIRYVIRQYRAKNKPL